VCRGKAPRWTIAITGFLFLRTLSKFFNSNLWFFIFGTAYR